MSLVFVFSSNLNGDHKTGSAKHALAKYGAIRGAAYGPQGDSFAIPTKDKDLKGLPLKAIGIYIGKFLDNARRNPENEYRIVRVGCGLTGYSDEEVSAFFKDAPANCVFDPKWKKYLGADKTYWVDIDDPLPAKEGKHMQQVNWARRGYGFETSSKGDRRFSAFNAKLGKRSIEEIYQCDIKGYDPGGRDWRKGKGNPPLDPKVDLWKEYMNLWRQWANQNDVLIQELYQLVRVNFNLITDMFANTEINQARALATILNERYYKDAKDV